MRDEVAWKATRQDLDVCNMLAAWRVMRKERVGLETIVKAIEFIYEPSAVVRQPATDLSETRTTGYAGGM